MPPEKPTRTCNVYGTSYENNGSTTRRLEHCLFHGFFTDTNRDGQLVIVAIVETPDGNIETVSPTRIEFTDRA